jgi:hypothetical protein
MAAAIQDFRSIGFFRDAVNGIGSVHPVAQNPSRA